ncbi:HAD-like domain-containing protein [Rhizobium sp. NXC24]|nr:HAD-like domain-containing protein [Rhizobium sp. NXC24]
MVVFDLDGTLADISARRIHLEGDRPDWTSFNGEMWSDVPNHAIVELYKVLWQSDQFNVILTSGRNERHRQFTENWLFWNNIPFGKIYMRPDGDNRADHALKSEFLADIRRHHGDVLFAVDDRQKVVDMWRSNGIVCLQCDRGDF